MNQFTQASEDLSKIEVELSRMGYTNKTHTGPYSEAVGMLWDRMTQADNVADILGWSDEAANDRAEQYRVAYNGWAAVAKQLAIAEAEIEAAHKEAERVRIEKQTDGDFAYDYSFC